MKISLHLLKYEFGTPNYIGKDIALKRFTNVDYASDVDDKISTGAHLFTVGNNPMSWSSKKKNIPSRSTCKRVTQYGQGD